MKVARVSNQSSYLFKERLKYALLKKLTKQSFTRLLNSYLKLLHLNDNLPLWLTFY